MHGVKQNRHNLKKKLEIEKKSTCLMGTFKMTEYNMICKVFTKFFLITWNPHCAVVIHFGQSYPSR